MYLRLCNQTAMVIMRYFCDDELPLTETALCSCKPTNPGLIGYKSTMFYLMWAQITERKNKKPQGSTAFHLRPGMWLIEVAK